MGTQVHFNVRSEPRDGYLYCEVLEDITVSNYETIFQDILEEGKNYNLNKILIDIRNVKLLINFLNRYEIGTFMAEIGKHYKIAALTSEEEMSRKFAETVARNRGLHFYVFSDEKEALIWLLE